MNLLGLMKYKCDDYLFILYYDYRGYNSGWCEICEEIIEKGWIIYICCYCFIILYVDCILGKYFYLKCGNRIKVNGFEVEIGLNVGVFCFIC